MCFIGGENLYLGITATVNDIDVMRTLGADFIELLVQKDDDIKDIERLLMSGHEAFVLHAPEHVDVDGTTVLLDLAADDGPVREHSVLRVNEISETAARYGVPLVVHPGGIRPMKVDPAQLMDRLVRSLNSLEGRLWIENMPRRYHIGSGLWFCNLLLAPEEFDRVLPFVEGITLNVPHAYLSVEGDGNAAIAHFFELLSPSIMHVHLSDGKYPYGEALRAGHGDIDLGALPSMNDTPVLLEVWSEHENSDARAKEALETVRGDASMFQGCKPGPVSRPRRSW